jgi:hypothetical protein
LDGGGETNQLLVPRHAQWLVDGSSNTAAAAREMGERERLGEPRREKWANASGWANVPGPGPADAGTNRLQAGRS